MSDEPILVGDRVKTFSEETFKWRQGTVTGTAGHPASYGITWGSGKTWCVVVQWDDDPLGMARTSPQIRDLTFVGHAEIMPNDGQDDDEETGCPGCGEDVEHTYCSNCGDCEDICEGCEKCKYCGYCDCCSECGRTADECECESEDDVSSYLDEPPKVGDRVLGPDGKEDVITSLHGNPLLAGVTWGNPAGDAAKRHGNARTWNVSTKRSRSPVPIDSLTYIAPQAVAT